MFPLVLSTLLTVSLAADAPAIDDAKSLIATIESLQQPVEDFRCEFEGKMRFMGKVGESFKVVRDDGLYEEFGGTFIWKRGGDTHSESLHRRVSDGQVTRESLVVRMRQQQAEQYHRLNDAPIGFAVIKNPKEANSDQMNCFGSVFLIDTLKRIVADVNFAAAVYDDQIDGRPLKVLNLTLTGVPNSSPLIYRFWLDLARNGHVVRKENYFPGKVMGGRLDIKLAPFKVGDAEVWMPVSGRSIGYLAIGSDKRPFVTKEVTSDITMYVVDGTMEFNKRPGPGAFTIKYKPGTPISDNLRKLTYEFGQQKIDPRPTKADAARMLNEQLAKAEAAEGRARRGLGANGVRLGVADLLGVRCPGRDVGGGALDSKAAALMRAIVVAWRPSNDRGDRTVYIGSKKRSIGWLA